MPGVLLLFYLTILDVFTAFLATVIFPGSSKGYF